MFLNIVLLHLLLSPQTEETAAQREEGAPGKRKRKKKKKAKGAVEDAEEESEEPAMYQELPKFEVNKKISIHILNSKVVMEDDFSCNVAFSG